MDMQITGRIGYQPSVDPHVSGVRPCRGEVSMHVLIVEPSRELGGLWSQHLRRMGARVTLVHDQDGAVEVLRGEDVQVIVLNLLPEEGSAFAIADYASVTRPEAKVVFVTNTTFFSDGSIFRHVPNASGFLGADTPPEDLAAMVDYWGGH
jgi:CheY-like chemotaxis protein